jgi:hypothetical protein
MQVSHPVIDKNFSEAGNQIGAPVTLVGSETWTLDTLDIPEYGLFAVQTPTCPKERNIKEWLDMDIQRNSFDRRPHFGNSISSFYSPKTRSNVTATLKT